MTRYAGRGGSTAKGSSVALGNRGSVDLMTGAVIGEDPLAPFGPRARAQVAEVDGYATAADVMVNSRFDPELEEVAAFEDQAGRFSLPPET